MTKRLNQVSRIGIRISFAALLIIPFLIREYRRVELYPAILLPDGATTTKITDRIINFTRVQLI